MTDPTATPNPSSETPAAPATETPPAAPENWLEAAALPDDVRKNPAVLKHTTPESMARALIHAESHLGIPADQLVRWPKPDDKEGIAAIFTKLGRPETPDGYKATVDGDQMDQATFSAFKAQAHELGLSDAQVEGLAKWYGATGAQTMQALQEADTAARVANETSLKKELGSAYDDTIAAAADAALKYGGEDFAKYLDETGMGNDPRAIKAWAAVAKAAAEPGAPDESQRGRDPQNRSLTPQEAEAELQKMEADPEIQKILRDANHPNKPFHHERRLKLIQMTQAGKA